MNLARIAMAALGAFVAYFALGGLAFARPGMRDEYRKYPNVYRTQEAMKALIPAGMLSMLLSMVALAILFAMIYPAGAGLAAGARFGTLIAVFALGSTILHNHVNLNIGARLSAFQAVFYSITWLVAGIVISAIYRP